MALDRCSDSDILWVLLNLSPPHAEALYIYIYYIYKLKHCEPILFFAKSKIAVWPSLDYEMLVFHGCLKVGAKEMLQTQKVGCSGRDHLFLE